MARSHAKVLCAVWRDPAWTALTARAQWVYVLILSQQKLSLVGSIDLTPGKWATLADGVTRDAIESAVDELEDHQFLVADHDTGEVLVRSFTRHDIDPNRVNINLAKGLWGQWGSIASRRLRSVALHEMPEPVWAKLEPHAPPDAVQTRRSARLEPASTFPVADRSLGPGTQPPSSSLLPPVDNHPPVEALPVGIDLEHHDVERIPEDHVQIARHQIEQLRAKRGLSVVSAPPPDGALACPTDQAAGRSVPTSPLATPQAEGQGREDQHGGAA